MAGPAGPAHPPGGDSLPRPAEARLTGRGILRFLVGLVVVWALLQFLVWPWLQPIYSAAVTRTADAALGLLELGERVTRLSAEGAHIQVFSDLREDAEASTTFDANVMHFYLVLFASVILVFPSLGLRRRAVVFITAMTGLFLFHTATVLINVEHMYAVELANISRRNYSDTERAVWGWLRHTVDYFAIELMPAAALVLLVVFRGRLGMRRADGIDAEAIDREAAADRDAAGADTGAIPSAQPGEPARARAEATRRTGRRAALATVTALALLGAAGLWLHLPKVRARQAEKQTLQGYRALTAGGFSQATTHFNDALASNPQLSEARSGLGQTQLKQGRLPEAVAEFRTATEQAPDNPLPHLHLGNALFNQADFAGAAAQFETALKLDPNHREALFNLAMTLKKLGRREEAETKLRRVIEISPDFADAYVELSASMIATNRACGAVGYLGRLAVLEPSSGRGELARQTLADLAGRCGER